MIMTDEEIENRLNSPSNLALEIREITTSGRGVGDKGIPPLVRELIGGLSHDSYETQETIAGVFDISESSVNTAARGLVGNRMENGLASKVKGLSEERLNTAHDMALEAMVESLDLVNKGLKIHPQKLETLSRIAKNMSTIASNIKPPEEKRSSVKVILFAPGRMRDEKEYEVIDV